MEGATVKLINFLAKSIEDDRLTTFEDTSCRKWLQCVGIVSLAAALFCAKGTAFAQGGGGIDVVEIPDYVTNNIDSIKARTIEFCSDARYYCRLAATYNKTACIHYQLMNWFSCFEAGYTAAKCDSWYPSYKCDLEHDSEVAGCERVYEACLDSILD